MDTKFKFVTLRMELEKEIKLYKAITKPKDAAEFFREQIGNMDRETVGLLCFNSSKQPVSFHLISNGSLDSSIVHPRELFKTAILSNAESIMIGHNHPSGNINPSEADSEVTDIILKCGCLMQIPLLDHIIVAPGEENYFSFREADNMIIIGELDLAELDEGGIQL